ncbi:MAG: hypothetical protein JW990_01745 [Thermoleophilia bacterium]|nr:hypothetical protein [Thermoleophilia bacterium]
MKRSTWVLVLVMAGLLTTLVSAGCGSSRDRDMTEPSVDTTTVATALTAVTTSTALLIGEAVDDTTAATRDTSPASLGPSAATETSPPGAASGTVITTTVMAAQVTTSTVVALPVTTTTLGPAHPPITTPAVMTRPEWTRYQESECGRWTGGWVDVIAPGASGGRCRAIDGAGTLTVRFRGTRVALVAGEHPENGMLRVLIHCAEGAEVGVYVDLYDPEERWDTVWISPSLPEDEYELTAHWTGDKNEAAGGTGVNIDAIDVIGRVMTP